MGRRVARHEAVIKAVREAGGEKSATSSTKPNTRERWSATTGSADRCPACAWSWTLPSRAARMVGMGGTGRDLWALARSAGMAGFVPKVRRRSRRYAESYDRFVQPLVEATVSDPARRTHVTAALRAAVTKLGFLLAGYADMAGVAFREDVAALAGAVTRLYDDLIDEFGGDKLDERLAVLFAGGPFVPCSDLEDLLYKVYRELERRIGRDPADPVFTALRAMHDYQTRSKRQQDPAIPAAVLAEITEGKGGNAVVVLFGLMRPAMNEPETRLVWRLGGLLQLLDDYQDVVLDRRTGLTTAVTRGDVTLSEICRRLRELRPAMRAHYGRIRPFFAVVYAVLWFSFVRHHWPEFGDGAPRRARRWRCSCALATILCAQRTNGAAERAAGGCSRRPGKGSWVPWPTLRVTSVRSEPTCRCRCPRPDR